MKIQKRNTAFTLIELLVVMVIVGILATIGIGAFNSHMERAREARIFSYGADVSNELKRQATLKQTSAIGIYNFNNSFEDSSSNGADMSIQTNSVNFVESKNTFLGSHFLSYDGGRIGADPSKTPLINGEFSVSYLVNLPENSRVHAFYISYSGGELITNYIQGTFMVRIGGTTSSNHKFFTPEKWYHVLNTYKDNTIRVYINGELKIEETPASPPSAEKMTNLRSGNMGSAARGDIDNLEVYPFALDVSNLQAPR